MTLSVECTSPVRAAISTAPVEENINQKLVALNAKVNDLGVQLLDLNSRIEKATKQFEEFHAKIPNAPDEEVYDLFTESIKLRNKKNQLKAEKDQKQELLAETIHQFNSLFESEKHEIMVAIYTSDETIKQLFNDKSLMEKEVIEKKKLCDLLHRDLNEPKDYVEMRKSWNQSKEVLASIDKNIKKVQGELGELKERLTFFLNPVPVYRHTSEELCHRSGEIRVELNAEPEVRRAGKDIYVTLNVTPAQDTPCRYFLAPRDEFNFESPRAVLELRAKPGPSLQNPKNLFFKFDKTLWRSFEQSEYVEILINSPLGGYQSACFIRPPVL